MSTATLERTTLHATHGELSAALDLAGALAPTRVPVPILAGVLISAGTDGTASVESFDYENYCHVTIGESQQLDRILVDRRLLSDCVKSLLAGSTRTRQAGLPITITAGGDSAVLTADGYRYTLPLMPAADYPEPPKCLDAQRLTVSRDALLAAVTRLSGFASSDKTLPKLTAINFATVDGGLELAATDRFRLGIDFVPCVETGVEVSRLVPVAKLPAILKRLPGGPATVEFSTTTDSGSEGYVWFRSGKVSAATRWMDEEFVRYRSLLPTDRPLEVVVDRQKLDMAVKRVASVIDRFHHLRLTFAGSTVTASSGGDEEGSVTSPPIPTEQNGPDLAGPIAFNPVYLGEALALYRTDSVSLGFTQPDRPMLIAEPGRLDDQRAFRSLVMPSRLPQEA